MKSNRKSKKKSNKPPQKGSKVGDLVRIPKLKRPFVLPNYSEGVGNVSRVTMAAPEVYYRTQAYRDQKNGIDNGLKLSYCGPVAIVATGTTVGGYAVNWAQYNTVYSGSSITGTISPTGISLPVNPWTIMPRFSVGGAMGTSYTRFQYTKLKIYYNGVCSTGNNASISATYSADGAFQAGDIGYYNALSQPINYYVPTYVRQEIDFSQWLNTKDWFYSDYDTTTEDAGYRESYQGIIVIYPNSTLITTANIDFGQVYIEAEVNLVEPSAQGQDIAGPLPPGSKASKLAHRRGLAPIQGRSVPCPKDDMKLLKSDPVEDPVEELHSPPILVRSGEAFGLPLVDPDAQKRLEIKERSRRGK